MEIYKELKTSASKEFEKLLHSQLSKTKIEEGKVIEGKINKISFNEVLKSIKKRDKSDYNRKISPLKKTTDSILINTTNLTKRACFLKIKKIIDKKIIT